MKNKDIDNFNKKGNYHGYQEWYWFDELTLRCNYKNGLEIGYQECHFTKQTRYRIR